ncbi:Transcriptional regulator, MerR family [hydrothermal vent metagenome]|uniref:Transcriptional regulator, MerR family n=1 Tax=hydrothermal vent metagenome TaxID=652676 RepID=A0A3B0U3G3_9ZZZZ
MNIEKNDGADQQLFAITEIAHEFGISTRTIRFYEAKGLLSPERVGSTRVFRKRDRARLLLILRGKRLGFSLKDISDYLSLYDADNTQKPQILLLQSKVDERLNQLEMQLQDLEITISELREIRQLAQDQLQKFQQQPQEKSQVKSQEKPHEKSKVSNDL